MRITLPRLAAVLAIASLAAGCPRSFVSNSTTGPQFGAISGVVVLQSPTQTFPALLQPDVDIVLTEPGDIQLHGLVTNQGVFTFGALAPGTYSLLVNVAPASGAPVLFAASTSVPNLVVSAGKTTNAGTITPSYIQKDEVDLFGLVHINLRTDAGLFVIDGGFDLTGTQVTVYFAGDESSPFAVTFTQADGTFGQQLPAGTYDLKATNHLFVPGTELGVVVGTADGGPELLSEPIVMAVNPARLTGTVDLEIDPNIVDAGAATDGGTFAPAAGVSVTTAFGGAGTTLASGVFTIDNLLGAPDQVSFFYPPTPYGETYHADATPLTVTLVPGDITNMGEVQLFLDRGTITGKVQMEDHSSVLGATVSIVGTKLAALVSPEADPSIGDFQFVNVPVHPGYTIAAAAPPSPTAHYTGAPKTVTAPFLGNGATVDVGILYLNALVGDFAITSTDPNAHPGYTNTLQVNVLVNGAPPADNLLRLAENPNFTAADGGTVPWVPLVTLDGGNPFTLSDADGYHTIYAEYEDPNNPPPGPLLTSTVLVDRVRPTQPLVTTTSGKTFVNTDQGVSITLVASDPAESLSVPASGVSNMVVAETYTGADLDGGILEGMIVPYTAYADFPPNASILADGRYTIYAQFYDNAGNASAIVTAPLVVDTIPPSGSLSITSLSASSAGFTDSALVVINELFSLPDGGTGDAPAEPNGGTDTIQLSNDSNTVANAPVLPASGSQTWSLDTSTGDGQKTVYMLITDSAGNISNLGTPYSATVFLERTAPLGTVSLIAPSAGGITSVNPSATNDIHVTLKYALNGGTASDPGATGVEASEQPTACSSLSTASYQAVTGTTATIAYTFAASGVDGGGVQDGNKTIFSCLRNAAGNTTQLETQVVLNRQAPGATVTVGDGDAFQSDTATTAITLSSFSSDTVGVAVSTSPLTCATADYQPFTPANPVVELATPTNGPYTVYVCVEDAAGNVTSLPAFSFTNDTTAPSGTLSIQGQLANASRAPSTTLTATPVVALLMTASAGPGDAIVSVQVANDSVGGLANAVAQPFISPFQWQLSNGDGIKQVFVQFTDEAGRVSPPVSAQITLDTSSPPVTMTISANGVTNPQATNANVLTVQYTIGAGANLPLQVALFSEPQTCSNVTSYGPMPAGTPPTQTYALTDGLYPDGGGPLPDGGALVNEQITLFACFSDAAGNTSSALATLIHDTIPPSGTASFGNGQAVQGSGAQNLIVTASTDTTQMLASTSTLNCATAPAASYVPFNTLTAETLPSGSSSLYVCLRDPAGNTAPASPFPVTVDVDSSAPTGTITLTGQLANHTPSTAVTSTPVVSVQVTAGAGVGDTVVSMQVANDSVGNLANAVPQTYTPTFTWQLSNGDGLKQVFVQFIDQAGKLSAPLSAQISLDTSSPPVTMVIVANGVTNPQITNAYSLQVQYTIGVGANLPLQVALSKAPQDCTTATGYGPMPSGSPPTQIYPLTDGSYPDAGGPLPDGGVLINEEVTLFACFEDPAGNTSSAIATFQRDTIPPSGTAVFGNGAIYQSSGAQNLIVTASSDATLMYVSPTSVSCGAVATSSFVPFVTNTPETLSAGNDSLYVCLRNQAGDSAAVSPFPVTVDVITAAPTITAASFTTLTGTNATSSRNVGVTFAGFTGSVTAYRLSTDQTFAGGAQPFVNFASQGSVVTGPQQVAYTLPSTDGTYTVYAQVEDLAGNVSSPATALTPVKLIQTAPSATTAIIIGAQTNPAYTNQSGVTLQFTVSANLIQFAASSVQTQCASVPTATWVNLSGAPPTSAFGLQGTGNPALTQSVYVCFRDAANNYASTTNTITYSTEAPIATMTVGNGAAYQNVSGNVPVVFSSFSSDTTGVVVSTSALTCGSATYGVFNTSNPTTTVNVGSSSATDGPYTVNACLKDAAGNTSALPSFSFTKDTVNPTITGATFTNLTGVNATNLLAVGVTFAGFTGPVTSYRLSTDQTFAAGTQPFVNFSTGGTAVSGTQQVAYSLPSGDGTKNVYAQVEDLAGNLSSPATALPAVKLIQTPPSATTAVIVGAATNPPYTNSSPVTLQFTVSANVTQEVASSSPLTCSSTLAWQNLSGAPPTLNFPLTGTGNPPVSESIYVCFRDAANNFVSTTNSIIYSTQPPTATMLVGNGAAYQNVSGNVPVTFSGFPADLTGVVVSTSVLTCSSASYTAFNSSSPTTSVPVGADGSYTVYACLKDAAGNITSLAPFSFTKDTIAPTTPIVTTPDQTIGTSAPATFVVSTSGPVTEVNFAAYQIQGGTASSWQTSSTIQSTTSFTFTLTPNTINQLSLRAIDLAGNISAVSSVFITWLDTTPSAPTLNQTWVVNRNGAAQVFWQDTSTTNLAGFYLYYDSSSHAGTTAYHGNYASNGPSPIFVPLVASTSGSFSLNLEGLTNGSLSYVTVRAVDNAGNVSGSASNPSEVVLGPNVHPLTQLSSIAMSGPQYIYTFPQTPVHMAASGDNIYVAYSASFPSLPDAGCAVTLDVINQGTLTSPVQSGSIETTGTGPSLLYTQTFYDGMTEYTGDGTYFDLRIDGPYLFLADGYNIRIFNITTPAAPTVAATVNLSTAYPDYQPVGLAVMGNKLYVGMGDIYSPGSYIISNPASNSLVLAIDLTTLYDRNVATSPSSSSVVGQQTNGYGDTTIGLAIAGTTLVGNGAYLDAYKFDDTLGASPTWVASDAYPVNATELDVFSPVGDPVVGANLLFTTTGSESVDIIDLNPLSSDGGVHILSSSSVGGSGQLDVQGHFALVSNGGTNELAVVDVSTPSSPVEDGIYSQLPSSTVSVPNADLFLGNYAVAAYEETGNFSAGTLQFYLAASPLALNVASEVATGASTITVGADLLYGGDGQAFDLTGSTLNSIGYPFESSVCASANCTYLLCAADSAWFDDDTLVQATGSAYQPDAGYLTDAGVVGYLAVLDTQGTINRASTPTAAGYMVALPAGERPTAVKAYGNYLIVGEMRSTGIWIEVFNAAKVRANHQLGNLAQSDSLGAIQLSTVPDDGLENLSLSVRDGVAVATLDEPLYPFYTSARPMPAALNGAGAWIVNLQPVMADNASSTLIASDVLATLAFSHARGSKLHGNNLYVASSQLPDGGIGGLSVLNISQAFSAPPLGTATTPANQGDGGFVQISDADSLDVWGSYAMVEPLIYYTPSPDALTAVDISNPSAPFVTSTLPLPSSFTGYYGACAPFQQAPSHTSVKVAGPQAFVSGQDLTAVINLQ